MTKVEVIPMRNRGFTLIELLVVVGIVLLLVALILPSLSYVRFISNTTACASNVREWNKGFMCYAADNTGYFPRFDPQMGTGHNVNEAGPGFTAAITKYGIASDKWICPMADMNNAQLLARYTFYQPTMYILTYSWYVPRVDNDGVMHPCAGYPKNMAGPSNPVLFGMPAGSPTNYADMPLVSCLVGSWSNVTPNPPTQSFISQLNQSQLNASLFHQWGGVLRNNTVGYPDGHVEVHPVSKLNHYWNIPVCNYYSYF